MKIPSFLVELIQRLFKKNPAFFKKIQLAAGVVAVIAFMPDLLGYLEIGVPNWLHFLESKAVKIGSLITIVMAQIPNEDINK